MARPRGGLELFPRAIQAIYDEELEPLHGPIQNRYCRRREPRRPGGNPWRRAEARKRNNPAQQRTARTIRRKEMKRWPTKPLREVGQLDRGRSRHRPRDEAKLYGGSYLFIQTSDVSNANGRITSYSQTYSELGLAQSRMWPAGTLCITIAANIGKTGVLTFPACFPDSIVGFIPGDQVRTDFVRYWFLTVQSRLEEQAPQAAQKNINLRIVGDLSVPLPPMAEQERILKLLDEADELRKLRAEADRRTAALIPALFHEMFGQHIAGPPVAISTAHLKAPREWRWAKLTEGACLPTGHQPNPRHP